MIYEAPFVRSLTTECCQGSRLRLRGPDQVGWRLPVVCIALCLAVGRHAVRAQPAVTLDRFSEKASPDSRPPNIVFILADDLGFGDLGCYGQNAIHTPHIDQLAAEGLRFTDHYAGSSSGAASRCTLLTGLHTGHARIRGSGNILLQPGDNTVAKILKQAGYVTGAIGIWGIGHPPPPTDPMANGFDHFYGYLDQWHAHNHFPDFLWNDGSRCTINGNVVRVIGRGGVAIKRAQYAQHLLTAKALEFIEGNAKHAFFLYLAFNLPHANTEAGEQGMEVPNDVPYSNMPWPEAERNRASMITRLDHSVGRIVDLLQRLKLQQNTCVFFTSDNGPAKEGGADPDFFNSTGGRRGEKGSLHEGGIRVPLVAWWPGRIQPGRTTNHLSALWDFLPTAAELAGVADATKGRTDGISYVPTLLGDSMSQATHSFLYWEAYAPGPVTQATRFGPWKAIAPKGAGVELYNLPQDPAEQLNVADSFPQIVRQARNYLRSAHQPTTRFAIEATDNAPKATPQ